MGRSALPSVPVVLLGAFPVETSEVYPAAGLGDAPPKDAQWTTRWAHGYAQPLAEAFDGQAGQPPRP